MRLNRLFALSVAAVTFLGLSAVSKAAPVPWQMPSGSTATFTYSNGNTDNQLFVPAGTSPIVSNSGIIFTPGNFKSSSANGTAGLTSDTLRFQIHVKPGSELSGFEVDEFGDYTILGTGPNTAVKAFGGLFITNLDTGEVRFDTLHTTPAPLSGNTGVTSGQGAWTGDEAIVGIPAGWANIQIVLDNVLQTSSDPGTSSFIEKKVATPGVSIDFILPEPGTLTLAGLACAMILSRRNRLASI